MDREKVIKGLECCSKNYCAGEEYPYYGTDCDSIKTDALALLKEQEPKPIVYTDNTYTGLPVAHCPKCGEFLDQFHSTAIEETQYCPWCGQAVKWE